jgi:hypothetical protein
MRAVAPDLQLGPTWHQLPDYTQIDVPTGYWADFMPSRRSLREPPTAKKRADDLSTTNMTYGCWFLD